MSSSESDPVLAALDALVDALRENVASSEATIERAEQIRQLRRVGTPYADIARETGRPLTVEMITDNIDRLMERGSAFRRSHAKALHAEGLTMDEIAALFGVTRQRVSAILRSAAE